MIEALIYKKVKDIEDNLTKAVDSNLAKDRMNEPCFATVSLYSSSQWGTKIYDHNLNLIASKRYGGDGSSGTTISELAHNFHGYTNGNVNSSSSTIQGTSSLSYLGHNRIDVAKDGNFHFHDADRESQLNVGTWVNNSTPNLTINFKNGYGWIGFRSYKSSEENSQFGEKYGVSGLNDSGEVGTIGYNEKSKTLAIVESDGTYNHRLNIWTDVKSPKYFKTNAEFFGQLTSENITQTGYFTGKPSSNSIEDNYRGVVVVADTGEVTVTKMIPSWGTYAFVFGIDSTTGNYVVPATTIWSDNYTTTYGSANGEEYGIRFQISNSGKYVVAYAPAYYYGSGYQATITEVSTGKLMGKAYRNTSNGFSFVPWRDNDFLISESENADSGDGVRIYPLQMINNFNSTTVTGATFVPSALMEQLFDNAYTSTDYPFIVPIMSQNFTKFVGER